MKIRILGPLEAESDGVRAVPTAAKTRQILALLALNPGQLVPVSALWEEVWGPTPPPSANATFQTYILRLRRVLATALGGPDGTGSARQLLATGHGGYLLRIAEEDVDAFGFQRAARAGHEAFTDGDSELASRLLRQALALWRGPALVDVRAGSALRVHVVALEESRLLATERRIDAELRLGRHSELLPELARLTKRHSTHERLYAQAMVAFYRSGRQAAAFDLYRGLRRRLIEDLGLEPAPQLQRLHQAMLAVDPRLDATAQGGPPTPTFDLYAA
ncbi:BTAD domain-containing putative transcriptional regulator [Streptomyces sp. NPDC088757]|uniref:AfsR/SARP family transcriptional regulator n=1 Tax=Streptomyces sp. NPDC088757 TaxID=3365889 RepID=UPI00380642BE